MSEDLDTETMSDEDFNLWLAKDDADREKTAGADAADVSRSSADAGDNDESLFEAAERKAAERKRLAAAADRIARGEPLPELVAEPVDRAHLGEYGERFVNLPIGDPAFETMLTDLRELSFDRRDRELARKAFEDPYQTEAIEREAPLAFDARDLTAEQFKQLVASGRSGVNQGVPAGTDPAGWNKLVANLIARDE